MAENKAVTDGRKQLMTTREVAILLNVADRTVARMAVNGEIPGAVKVRTMWRFNRAEVERFAGLGE